MSKKHFLHGALILTIAALISRILGAVYRIPLKQMTGDSGLAIYGAVYPVFSTILILVVAGIPVALSKLISEQVTIGNLYEEKRITRIALGFISVLGFSSFLMLYFGAGIISTWIGMPVAEMAIKSVSFTLLMIPFLAVLRGFFYGHQHIAPSAISQVIEQIFRVATILIFTTVLVKAEFSLEVVIAGATFGTVIGVLISTIYLSVKYIRFQQTRKDLHREKQKEVRNYSSLHQIDLFKKIFFFTIAISISSLMIPLFGLADTFTAVNLLKITTGSSIEAQDWFGVYNRFLPFVQLTTIFATSLALSLVPKIAESGIQQNNRDISHSAYLALKITVLLGLPASVGLALLSSEVNLLFYGDELGSIAFSVIALASFFLTLGITTVAILQGLGSVFLPAMSLLFALIAKVSLNFILIPYFSIIGLAMSTFSAYAFLFLLNGFVMSRKLPAFTGWSRLFVKPVLATFFMTAAVFVSERLLRYYIAPEPTRMQSVLLVALLIGVGLLVYGVTILIINGISKHELLRIPKYGAMIVSFLERLHLLKTEKATG